MRQVESAEARVLDAVAAATGCGLVLLDEDGLIVYRSPQIEEICQGQFECRVGEPWAEVMLPLDGLEGSAAEGLMSSMNFYEFAGSGDDETFRLGVLRQTSGYPEGQEEFPFTVATPDGIPSERALQDLLRQLLANMNRYQTPFSLLFLKIRNFQTFVEVLGNQCWNITVRAVFDQLLAIVRMADCVGLYDSSTYWAVLTNTGQEGAMVVADKIKRLAGSMKVEEINVFLSVAVGGVEARPDDSEGKLIERALGALQDGLKKHDAEAGG